jgi:4a-hydroxytetrahydrobiopterin dehydratase
MKPSSAPAKTSQTKARNAMLMNLAGTPGLGSLMGRRWFEGTLQLLLAIIGFVLALVWFFKLMAGEIDGNIDLHAVAKIGLAGMTLFILAWVWSLITSLSLVAKAKQAALPMVEASIPAMKADEAQIQTALTKLPLWRRQDQVISRTFEFSDFVAAMKFVNDVAEIAEAAQHHPDIDVRWNKVTLAFTTHDAGGLSQKDFAFAQRCDGLAVSPPRL